MKNSAQNRGEMSGLIDLIRINPKQAQCDIWFKQAEDENGRELPIFCIAWGSSPWGDWIGWN